ncbi:hypothetical protein E4U58_001907 [Claviceps cyperi]|nr:hypothetical protein E4U58_001907 [Claviceps cyperi]
MPIGGIALPVYHRDAETRRRLRGPTLTKDELLLEAAIRVAQIEAGKRLYREIKAKEKRAEKAQERKAAKDREEKAARARAQKEAAEARENKLRVPQGLNKTQKKRWGERFVSLPSGLTMSRSALAETRHRASLQFGGGPSSIMNQKKADMKNQKSKNKTHTTMDSMAKLPLHGDTAKDVKRPSPATPRRTSVLSRAFCLC